MVNAYCVIITNKISQYLINLFLEAQNKPMKMRSLPVLIMGLSSILLQIISMRQLLTVFSGNELDIGITLSVWLTAVGTGSYIGHRLKFRNAFVLSFIAVAILAQPTILCMDLLRPFLGIGFGETVPLTTTIISTVFLLLPLCLVLGMQFPLAVSYADGDASKAYSLEATGAFIGGIMFTILLAGRTDVSILTLMISIVSIITASFLLKRKLFFLFLAIPLVVYFGAHRSEMKFLPKDMELVKRVESRYGEIKVLKIKSQMNVYSSGKYNFSYPDPQTEEIRAHMPMSAHPHPEHIMIIGGSPAVLREILNYPILKLDFLEIDPSMIDVSLSLLSKEDTAKLNDKRLRIISEDARKFINKLQVPAYDMIILNLPEPATANINRFYTEEFFYETKSALKKDGILTLTLPTSSGYISRRMQTVNGSVYNSLRSVFGYTAVSSEEYGYLFASDSPVDISPILLENRFNQSMIRTENFRPYIFYDAFSSLKSAMVKERLGKISKKNKDMRPSAYLYNLMLWADIQGSSLLTSLLDHSRALSVFMVILIIAVSALLWRRNNAVYYSIFTTGYSTMAFSVIIILFYQAAYGYVYEMIGLLTSMFMAGMAVGAYIMKSVSRPMKWLRFFEAAVIVLFISSPLFFKQEVLFYILSLFCGMAGGVQFTLANQFMKAANPSLSAFKGERPDTARTAGRLYAFDLAGSFLGALLTSIFLLPIFGIQNTIIFVVLIKAVSMILIFSVRHEKA